MRIDGFYRSLRRRKDESELVDLTAPLPPSRLSLFDAASRAEWSVLSDRKQGNRGNGAVRPNSGLDPVRSGLRSR